MKSRIKLISIKENQKHTNLYIVLYLRKNTYMQDDVRNSKIYNSSKC